MNEKEYLSAIKDYFFQKFRSEKINVFGTEEMTSKEIKDLEKRAGKHVSYMYRDFPRFINPNISIVLKILASIGYFFLMFIPILNTIIARKIGNLLIQKVKLNPKETFNTSTHHYNRDRRYKSGYRNSYTTTKKKVVEDGDVSHWNLEPFEISHNRNWFFILVIPVVLICLLLSIGDLATGLGILVFIGLGFLLSLFSIKKNSKGQSSLFILEAFTGQRLINDNTIDDSNYDDGNYYIMINKSSSYPDEYKYSKKIISKWYYKKGEIVEKGTSLFGVDIEGISIYASDPIVNVPTTGKLVEHIPSGTILLEDQKCCVIEEISKIDILHYKFDFQVKKTNDLVQENIRTVTYQDSTNFRDHLLVSFLRFKTSHF